MASKKKQFLKIVILGDSGVGKTSLLQQYVNQKSSMQTKPTIGADFQKKEIIIDNQIVNLQIWDTAGQEQFRSITKLFYKNSQAAVIVYDVTKRDSFQNVESWLEEIEDNRDQEDMLVYLVGNRVDLGEDDDIR